MQFVIHTINGSVTLPDPVSDYVSAETYLEGIGFPGNVLIRNGNMDLLRKGFGIADQVNNVQNNPSLIY